MKETSANTDISPEATADMTAALKLVQNPHKLALGLQLATAVSPLMLLSNNEWLIDLNRANVVHVSMGYVSSV